VAPIGVEESEMPHIDPLLSRNAPREGAMIEILAVVVAVALVASLGWALLFGGLQPPSGSAQPRSPAAIGAPGPAVGGGGP
jgi:hypothetical protein